MLPDNYVIRAAANLSVPKPSHPLLSLKLAVLVDTYNFLVGDLIKFEVYILFNNYNEMFNYASNGNWYNVNLTRNLTISVCT